MPEENTSDGLYKSRSVLGDLTNRLRKREFSQREKNGTKSSNFQDKDTLKRVRVSPRPCTEASSLKGNVMSSISKIINETRNSNVDFGSDCTVSKSSSDVETDLDSGYCLKVTNVVVGNSKVLGGEKDIEILDLSRGNADFQSVNELDLEGEKAVNSTATEAFTRFKHTVSGNGVDESSRGKNDPNLIHLGKVNALEGASVEANDELGDSFRTLRETDRVCINDINKSDANEAKANPEGTQSDNDDLNDHNADNLLLSQSGSIDCTILLESQESRVFGVERSTEMTKGDDLCANMSGGTDSIKACSCSFCTKAAYIWLDLNYQDIKARVSAMKKSQKEASILAERSYRSKAMQKHDVESESSTKVPKLESDLMYQWRSLFQNMADIWEAEGNQLQTVSQRSLLRQKLHTLRKGNLSVSDYLTTISTTSQELAAIGDKIPDSDLLLFALNGLPPDYAPFITAIENSQPRPSFREFRARLLNHEQRLISYNAVTPPLSDTALAANTAAGRGRGSGYHRGNQNFVLVALTFLIWGHELGQHGMDLMEISPLSIRQWPHHITPTHKPISQTLTHDPITLNFIPSPPTITHGQITLKINPNVRFVTDRDTLLQNAILGTASPEIVNFTLNLTPITFTPPFML
ncbi:hypothetical protein BUALT_Bualt11G0014700 [Buddleja alternifolia]|uniref:Uncharacterized protein n=1 Tax=Buddleja alternifolia TaxID=168488 RepID=A0AAV6WY27_9LAMI|nr:hypothetical protein BUALT_Bualt11G0014700 [Buddleja alternifolia]